MRTELIFDDPLAGVQTFMHYDDSDDTFVIENVHDAEPALKRAKLLRDHPKLRPHEDKDMWLMASIPAGVQLIWMDRYGIKDIFSKEYIPLIKRLLNDPEWSHLRVHGGRL